MVRDEVIFNLIEQSYILENAKKNLPRFEERHESEYGVVHSISGPVVTAENMPGAQMYEIVRIRHDRYLGEIIQITGQTAKIQVFDETSGLHPGDLVMRTHHPLTVELGPGLINNLFDGIQRPLQHIAESSNSFLIPKGLDLPPLDTGKLWYFEPQMEVGDHITAGDVFGKVKETELVTHSILMPPKEMGTITFIAPAGEYSVKEFVLEVEFDGKVKNFTMSHAWPVRHPRPFVDKVACDTPLLIGTRVVDSLFPTMHGCSCVIPGNQGGKHTLLQTICKYANCDSVVYIGCSERSNEMTEALMSLPQLYNSNVPVIQRTSVVANVDNMSPAIRDASIYTGVTIAEYYRDMGQNVVLTADNTTRWAHSLMDIDANLGVTAPSEGGFPTYLASRLIAFYERAGKVSCLGSPNRTGSVSIFATCDPASRDEPLANDPMVKPTLSEVQAFWCLDNRLASRKHFPSINWLNSFSNHKDKMNSIYDEMDSEYIAARNTIEKILQEADVLSEVVKLAGKASLSTTDRITIEVEQVIREDFLQQNMFTTYDKYCPLYKTIWMAKNIVTFYEEAQKAASKNKNLTWDSMKQKLGETFYHLTCMKFMDPSEGQDKVTQKMKELNVELRKAMQHLE